MRSISAGGQPCMVDSVAEWTGASGTAAAKARAFPSAARPKAASKAGLSTKAVRSASIAFHSAAAAFAGARMPSMKASIFAPLMPSRV